MKQDTQPTQVQFRLFEGSYRSIPLISLKALVMLCADVDSGQHSVCNWNFNAVSKPATPEQNTRPL